jgi:hypothetical protein
VPLGAATLFTPAGLAAGANAVAVHAIDGAGNVGPEATILVVVAAPAGVWLGQDGADLVGPAPLSGPDGLQDVHIRLTGLPADRIVTAVEVVGLGGGRWRSDGLGGSGAVALVRAPGATTAELYFAPSAREVGRPFSIVLGYDNGTGAGVWVPGGVADPGLRVPTTAPAPVPSPGPSARVPRAVCRRRTRVRRAPAAAPPAPGRTAAAARPRRVAPPPVFPGPGPRGEAVVSPAGGPASVSRAGPRRRAETSARDRTGPLTPARGPRISAGRRPGGRVLARAPAGFGDRLTIR